MSDVKKTKAQLLSELHHLQKLQADLDNMNETGEINKRLDHQNRVLDAIRRINQLIRHEKDRSELLSKACGILIETRGYYNAWIALLRDGRPIEPFFHAGFTDGFDCMSDFLRKGAFPQCARMVFESKGIHVLDDPLSQCVGCPLVKEYKGRGGLTMRLEHDGQILGWISVSVPKQYSQDKNEHILFAELSDDIASALWSIDAEAKYQSTEIQYAAVLASTTDAVVVSDMEGRITLMNPGAEKLVGCSQAEAAGSHVSRFCPADLLQEQEEMLRRVVETSSAQVLFSECLTADGRRIPVEVSASPLNDKDGKPSGITAILRDISERNRIENLLRENEEKYRSLYENAPLAYQSLDQYGCFLDVNPTWLKMLGYERDEVIGKCFAEFLHPDWESHFQTNFPAFKQRGYVHDVQFKIRHKDGHYLDISFEGCVGYHLDGSFRQTYCVFKDITESKHAEQALRESEQRFKSLYDSMTEGVCLHEMVYDDSGNAVDYRIIDVNPAYESILGFKKETVVGRLARDVYGGEPPYLEIYSQVAQKGEPVQFDTYYSPLGKHFSISVFSPKKDQFATVFSDITARKKSEKELEEMSLRLQEAVNGGNIGLWDWDLKTNDVLYSREWKSQIGYKEDEISGRYEEWESRLHPDDLEQTLARIHNLISEKREKYSLEFRFRHKDGSYRWIYAQGSVIADENGQTVRVVGSHIDVTDRKRAEKEIRRSAKKMQSIFRAAPIGIGLVVDREFQEVNEKFCDMVGYEKEELIGMSSKMIYPNDKVYEDVGKYKYGQIQKDGTGTVETKFKRKDGRIIDILLSSTPLDPSDYSAGVTFTALDITERKQAEEALRKSEFQKRIILNSTAEMVTYFDTDFRVIWVNRAAGDSVNKHPDELIGKRCYEIWNERGEPCEDCPVLEVLATKKSQHIARETPDGRYWNIRGYPVMDDNDQVVGLVEFAQEVTEIQRAEKERKELQTQLNQAQKMEAIGTLAGGIAHDFNNILTALIGYTELVSERIQRGNYDVLEDLETVLKAGNRAKELVSQILQFSRYTDTQLKPLEIRLVVKEVMKLLRATIPSSIEIQDHISIAHEKILADATNIHQVIMNLCANAYQSMPDGTGELTIGLDLIVSKYPIDCHLSQIPPDTYIRLHVGDTGTGMGREILNRIFDPYFSTKGRGEGTGLGLAVTYGIVTSLGGGIQVDSEIGRGTDFFVFFPVIPEYEEEPLLDSAALCGGNERILIVDDEVFFTDLTSRILDSFGYRTVMTNDSLQALELFAASPDDFDLVISDQTMPKMTGLELVKRIHDIRPDIPVIMCTGFSEVINKTHKDQLGVSRILFKPTTKRSLVDAVRKVLDNG